MLEEIIKIQEENAMLSRHDVVKLRGGSLAGEGGGACFDYF